MLHIIMFPKFRQHISGLNVILMIHGYSTYITVLLTCYFWFTFACSDAILENHILKIVELKQK